ncbi:hypothetical protein [Xanthomonas sp. BRIP62415]|uniref:hypothetical protein n=1 Tax=Xanthomonas sp. BRIP62415 TaxID=2182390 RepID=UPI000F8EEF5A|nr:hypothetical protein [Xanthomonas sp. BRIP62415]
MPTLLAYWRAMPNVERGIVVRTHQEGIQTKAALKPGLSGYGIEVSVDPSMRLLKSRMTECGHWGGLMRLLVRQCRAQQKQ